MRRWVRLWPLLGGIACTEPQQRQATPAPEDDEVPCGDVLYGGGELSVTVSPVKDWTTVSERSFGEVGGIDAAGLAAQDELPPWERPSDWAYAVGPNASDAPRYGEVAVWADFWADIALPCFDGAARWGLFVTDRHGRYAVRFGTYVEEGVVFDRSANLTSSQVDITGDAVRGVATTRVGGLVNGEGNCYEPQTVVDLVVAWHFAPEPLETLEPDALWSSCR